MKARFRKFKLELSFELVNTGPEKKELHESFMKVSYFVPHLG